MTPPRGTPRLPPRDFPLRDLARHVFPFVGQFWRLSHEKAPHIDWSDNSESRLSHPSLPYKVLYIASTKETCFWERFGEDLRDQQVDDRAISVELVKPRVWKRVTIEAAAGFKCLDLRDANVLRAMNADGATFFATYDVTQRWAEALMLHPAGVDAVMYQSRLDTPETCVALLGTPKVLGATAPSFDVTAAAIRPIDDPELLAVFVKQRIALLRSP